MDNSLNFIRYIAAFMVFVTHSIVLRGGETLSILTIHLGRLGVYIFFIISGYLVSKSWDRSPHLLIYFKKRALRIFPALVVCVFLSVFLLGAFVTLLPIKIYFQDILTYKYLLNSILYIVYQLPGVFTHLPYPNVVNGSLWTLPVEFFMYIIVALLGFVFKANRYIYFISLLLFLFLYFFIKNPIIFYATDFRAIFHFGIFFIIGALIQKFYLQPLFTLKATILSFVLIVFFYLLNLPVLYSLWISLPVIVLYFGLQKGSFITKHFQKNDYSYGIYIYAFPIQQTMIFLFPTLNFFVYFIISFLFTQLLAYFSWHIVEKKALKRKQFKKL